MSEQNVEVNSEDIEKAMLEAAETRAQDPMEMASTVYGMYIPTYNAAIPKLSTRALRRVLNYIVKYPLEQDDIKAASDSEKQLMALVNSLVEAKFIIIMHQYSQHMEQLSQAADSELTEEEREEIQKTLDNHTHGIVE